MTTHPNPILAPRPPLVAYREDLARRGDGGTFGPSDATWLSVATVLSHGVDVAADSRPPLLATIREVLASDPALSGVLADVQHDGDGERELDAVSPIVRAVVARMEDAGALSLAYSTLSILAEADVRLSALERGRVLAQLGRVAWKAGALETSRELYHRVEVLGRAARSTELRVRAWIGYCIVARLRGNYPEVRKWATRAAHEADRAGLAALGVLAYQSLMVSAGVAGDYNAALVYGWRAFQGAVGDPSQEAEMLLNVSQLLYETGHAEVAVHGFAAALARRPTPRVALPALGGLAVAASALGDAARVRSAHTHAERLIRIAGLPHDAASALAELCQALHAIGDAAAADDCRARASEIAVRQGYHEITHRLEVLQTAPTCARGFVRANAPHALDPHAAAVARAVTSLDLIESGVSAE